MKLINTTKWPDYFLRRLVSWCCREIGFPVRSITQIRFTRRCDGRTSGRAWWPSNRIHISAAGTREDFDKSKCWGWCGEKDPVSHERRRTNSLVSIVAHEIVHLWLYRETRIRTAQEPKTRRHTKQVLDTFLSQREKLLSAWTEPPKERQAKPKRSLQEKRAVAAQRKLTEWMRKQKLANTKVKQYRAKVRYYDRAAAAKKPNGD